MLSIFCQSALPDEIIIADDGSSEDIPLGIADLIPMFDIPITHVFQKDTGFRLAKSRNNAARIARGEYLLFFDQDLVFTKNYLRQIIENKKESHFYTTFPVWLSEEQTRNVDSKLIETGDFENVSTLEQREFIVKQYWKEQLYTFLHKYKLRKIGPSLRGAGFAFFKKDFMNVNGFDEKYQEWGYEDDDLGYRLYASGVKGYNPIKTEYAMHCYHPKAKRPDNWERSLNRKYYIERKKEVTRRNYRCEYGIQNPLGNDAPLVRFLN
jgi:GT2 family glycosyltransferase